MVQYEGPGWRLARDNSRIHFPVMIGGDGWALELTEKEWICLLDLINDLIDQHKKLKSQLMKEELISLELERNHWWVCLDGNRDSWSLKLIFEYNGEHSRGFEAYWPIPAAQGITSAMSNMCDTC